MKALPKSKSTPAVVIYVTSGQFSASAFCLESSRKQDLHFRLTFITDTLILREILDMYTMYLGPIRALLLLPLPPTHKSFVPFTASCLKKIK